MRSILYSTLVVVLLALGFSQAIAQPATCEAACAKYRECAVDIWKKNNKVPTAEQSKTMYGGCMRTCGKFKEKTLVCYKQTLSAKGDACMTYWSCVQSAYNSGKK